MTMLSNVEIREAIESGEIRIEPFRPDHVQPASYDLTLANEFKRNQPKWKEKWDEWAMPLPKYAYGVNPLDPETYRPTDDFKVESGIWLFARKGYLLGCTAERITLGPSIAAQVGGKSSLARLGIEVHLTAGFCDPGFDGAITLDMVNNGPDDVLLTVGMDIAQLVFYRLGKPADPPYQGRYQGATGTQASKYHEGRGS